MITLYKLDANGAMNVWCAYPDDEGFNVEWGHLNGAVQYKFHPVSTNQSGRDINEQIELEMSSAASRKMDAGYRQTIAEAECTKNLNAMNKVKPMLATAFKSSKLDPLSCSVQYKYDGNRCLIHNDGKELVAYTRNGKRIMTVDHILSKIDIPTGVTLDGELYCHGKSLQEIVSLIKREQPDTSLIDYMCFDQVAELPFIDRFLDMLEWDIPHIAATWRCEDLEQEFSDARAEGYEGLILRDPCGLYQAGKRSKGVVKVKATTDGYFIIEKVVSSKDGWARLICTDGTAMRFTVSAPGRLDEREQILSNANQYVGRKVRVEYAGKTKDGIPFHPVATLIV